MRALRESILESFTLSFSSIDISRSLYSLALINKSIEFMEIKILF